MSLVLDLAVAGLVLFVVVAVVLPAISRAGLGRHRRSKPRALERERGSRVVSMIHRQESISPMGMALSRYIDVPYGSPASETGDGEESPEVRIR